jgi:hypothetical protein
MTKILAGKLTFALAGLFAFGQAQAHPSQVATYVYYSGTQPVGQSILSCEGFSQHWGSAPLANQAGAVSVVYSCATGSAIRIIIPTSVDPWVQANFCNTTGICDEGPGLVNGAGVLVPGFNSN